MGFMHLPFYFRKEFLHKGIIIFANTKFSENEKKEEERKMTMRQEHRQVQIWQ